MRICMIMSLPFPPEDGVGNFVYNLSRELAKKGHSVAIVTRGSLRGLALESEGIRVYRPPFFPIYPLHVQVHGLFVGRLWKAIGADFDVVHYHTPLPPPVRTGLPAVTTVHSLSLTEAECVEPEDLRSLAYRLQAPVSYLVERELLGRSDVVTAVSHSLVAELAGYGVPAGRVGVIGNGVDAEFFCPAGAAPGEKYVLYAGRLGHRKGLFDFLDCAEMLCAEYPNLTFRIAGKGPLGPRLLERIERSGYGSRFEVHGYVDGEKLRSLYRGAMAYVLPSHYEGLPTTLLEAMACGVPVIATDVGGSRDLVETGRNGILVPPRSPGRMARAVSSILDDGALRESLGRAARRTVEGGYTWDRIADKVLECYARAMGKKPGAGDGG